MKEIIIKTLKMAVTRFEMANMIKESEILKTLIKEYENRLQ